MGVDWRAIGGLVGSLLAVLSLTLLVPAALALYDGDALAPFLVPFAGGLAVGLALRRLAVGARPLRAHDGFLAVALVWLAAAVLAAVPYMIEGGDVSSPVDAFFESMAGVTATGASNMIDIESHGRAILFWRSLTQWLGGLGIIVLVLAVLPRLAAGGRQLMTREVPGPQFDKLAPRMRDTAKRFWLLYAFFTGLEILILWILGLLDLAPGMDLFNAVCHAFTTLSAGGFSPNARSIEPFGAWAQWTIVVFMIIAGTNFALWYRGLFRGLVHFRRDEELRVYLALMTAGSALIIIELLTRDIGNAHDAVRNGVFQTVSVMTGTGFASTDYAQWTALTFSVLLLLMFVGGMAGSPTGALKVARHLLIWKFVGREIRRAAAPPGRHAAARLGPSRGRPGAGLGGGLHDALRPGVRRRGAPAAARRLAARQLPGRGAGRVRGLRGDARQRRAGARLRGADGELRAVLGRLEAAHVRPDVDGRASS